MSKRTVRLTESELKSIITESVKNIISELDWRTYANAEEKQRTQDRLNHHYDYSDNSRVRKFSRQSDAEANKKFFGNEEGLWGVINGNENSFIGFSAGRLVLQYDEGDIEVTKDGLQKWVSNDGGASSHPVPCDIDVIFEVIPDYQLQIAFLKAMREYQNFRKGNSVYVNKPGWYSKDNL